VAGGAARYEHCEGVAKDAFHAYELYCVAAREGDAEAQYALGWLYANSRGVARSDELAALFFTLAAEQGHAQAKVYPSGIELRSPGALAEERRKD
jgi:TPR repeat protein